MLPVSLFLELSPDAFEHDVARSNIPRLDASNLNPIAKCLNGIRNQFVSFSSLSKVKNRFDI